MNASRVIGLVAWCSVALVACAPNRPTAYMASLAAGDRAHSAGREREAARAYDEASHATTRPLDRDEAMFRAALSWRHVGDTDAALERFDWLATHALRWERGERAAFEAGRMRLESTDATRGLADLEALIVRAPDTGPARRAVDLVLEHLDGQDSSGAASLAWIDATEPRVRDHDLEVALRWLRARRLERLGRDGPALAAYERLLEIPYPRNMHWDDGGLAYATRLRALERPADALAVIERILARREIAVLRPGSDERPHFQELGLLRARILRDDLHDPARAAEAYHRFFTEFPDSLHRDNVLWDELELRDALGQRDRACDLAGVLARDFACTRFGRRGAARTRECGHPVGDEVAARCHTRSDAGAAPR